MKILVAEDSDTSRAILTSMLRKWSYEVIEAADGAAAWDELQKPDAPRLVLLDWIMPKIDGLELCRMIRANLNKFQPYVIFVTAQESKQDIIKGLEAGANDYLTKPYDIGELRARVGVGVRVVELQEALAKRVAELEEALAHIKQLQGILPICMYCHKIRTDKESWERIEKYISEHSNAVFSHGICPDCYKKIMESDEFKNLPQVGSKS
ncbi:MAG: response regulator [Verrucomicrobiia bacterium]|jgi:DNA-binding response OmpR family regulator